MNRMCLKNNWLRIGTLGIILVIDELDVVGK
jgi:hypothetical protein